MSFLVALPRPTATYHSSTYPRLSPSKTTFSGQGKTVLITGGSEGIGLSIAKSFAETGVTKIIIASRNPGPQATAKETLSSLFPDVEVQTTILSITDLPAVSKLLQEGGPIDILVLNAAYSHKHVPSGDIPAEDFEKTFTANVAAPFHMLQEYLAQPLPVNKTVISTSSAAAHLPFPGQSGYGPSKAAFTSVLQHLAVEHTPEKDGVRLFSFHPGVFFTRLAKEVVDESAFEWEEEDINLPGHFAVWLASPESTFLHGRFVWAQWDVNELVQLKDRVEKDSAFLTMGLVM